MKSILLILSLLLMHSISWSQTPIGESNNGYSDWLFVNSDKALQVRYKLVKKEDKVGYFEAQFRINFEDPIYCSHPTCIGYLFVLSYPTLDNQESIKKSYKFYNTFKGIYTLPFILPINLSFPNGDERFLLKEGFFYTTVEDKTPIPNVYLFSNCVDNMLSNNPNHHRCKPYKSDFKEAEAIILE